MKRRIFSILMAILLCTSMFAGCNNQGNSGELVIGTYEAPAKDAKATLKVICPFNEKQAAFWAKNEFSVVYPNVTIEVTTYGYTDEDISELNKLQARQMAGDGADIVMMDNVSFPQVCDLNKVQQSGAYIDLNQYFDNDPNWSWEGYSTSVVEGMERGGKLYLLPLYFELTTLVTTDDLLFESGIDLNKCKTGIGLMNELEKCGERLAEEGDYSEVVDSYYWLTNFENVFGVNPFQFEIVDGRLEGKAVWSKDFDRQLKAYAAAGQQLGWFSDNISITDETYYERLYEKNFSFVASNGIKDAFAGIQMLALNGKKPVILPIYTTDGNGIAAEAALTASISTTSQNKELSYEFIKYMLKKDAQELRAEIGAAGYALFIEKQPINREAIEASVSKYSFYAAVEDASEKEVWITQQEYLEQYIELADQVTSTYTANYFSESMANYFYPYFQGKASLEDCYEDAKSKLEIYVSE